MTTTHYNALVLAELSTLNYPKARFRSCNTAGSDEAFSKGIAADDARRLQTIAPYKTHSIQARFDSAIYAFPDALSLDHRHQIGAITVIASPKKSSLMG